MKTKMQMFAMNTLAAVLVYVAGTGISPNCWFTTYEPNIPESLKGRDDVKWSRC